MPKAANRIDEGERDRRAALIADAPALLASLGWIVDFCDEHPEWFGATGPDDGVESEWLHAARALVSKHRAAS
jgi:hypothetical protein